MAKNRKEIFLSYGREPEVTNFVRRLKTDLEASGLSVWLDIDDIPAGCDWHAAIGSGLHHARVVIAVVTNKYICSRYCTSELYVANGDRKLIFPVLIEDIDFDISETAQGVKYVIAGINWTMFRPNIDDYSASLTKLISGLKEKGLQSNSDPVSSMSSQMEQMHMTSLPAHTMPHGHHHPHQPFPHMPITPPQPYPYAPPTHPSPIGPGLHPPPPAGNLPPPYNPQAMYGGQYPQHPYIYPPYQGAYPGYFPPPMMPENYPHSPVSAPPVTPSKSDAISYTSTPPLQITSSPKTDNGDSSQSNITAVTSTPPPSYSQLFDQPDQPYVPDSNVSSQADCSSATNFTVGMKVEAVDRRFPYFVCVATIMDHKPSDQTVLVHFDGWTSRYDYWCSRESVDLHPVGWCGAHSWELQKPNNYHSTDFQWDTYLKEQEAEAALITLFNKRQVAAPGSLHFEPGMYLEAKDRQHPTMVCVAVIQDIKDAKLLIHFEGWSSRYDYWCERNTKDIHPPMWCGKNGRRVEAPNGFVGHFKWSEFFDDGSKRAAPAHLFTKEQLISEQPAKSTAHDFDIGMRLEAKDRLNPRLVCVATIVDKKDNKLLIHFDGWTSKYDYWCKKTSADLHPIGYCAYHGIALQPPKGHQGKFDWNSYLSATQSVAVPKQLFSSDQK